MSPLLERAFVALGVENTLRDMIWKCNLSSVDVKKIWGTNDLWNQVLQSWSKINFRKPTGKCEALEQLLWYNSGIKISGKPIFWAGWFKKEIVFVSDLLNIDGTCKSSAELGVNWLDLKSVWSAIPSKWLQGDETPVSETTNLFTKLFNLNSSLRNRKVYDMLIDDNDLGLQKYANRWVERGVEYVDLEKYRDAFMTIFSCTNVSKLRDFQYRLLLGKIILNVDLYAWDISDMRECTFCKKEDEDTFHIFFLCEYVKPLINFFYEICFNCGLDANRNILNFLFNTVVEKKNHIVHFLCIFIKQYIYRMRCLGKKPTVKSLIIQIELHHTIELSIARSVHKVVKHNKKWSPIYLTPNVISAPFPTTTHDDTVC